MYLLDVLPEDKLVRRVLSPVAPSPHPLPLPPLPAVPLSCGPQRPAGTPPRQSAWPAPAHECSAGERGHGRGKGWQAAADTTHDW